MTATSKAAADCLALGFKPGDVVLFGEYVIKARVKHSVSLAYRKTHIPFVGKVVKVSPTGRLRVECLPGDKQFVTQLLNAHDSLRAVVLTPEQIERRSHVLLGWEDEPKVSELLFEIRVEFFDGADSEPYTRSGNLQWLTEYIAEVLQHNSRAKITVNP